MDISLNVTDVYCDFVLINSEGLLNGQVEVQFDDGKFNNKVFLYPDESEECEEINQSQIDEVIYKKIVDMAIKHYNEREVK